MDKEDVKDKLNDLMMVLAIVLGVVGFCGAFFLPDLWFTIVFFLAVACLHLWFIKRIIARYKTMPQAQRKSVVYYFLLLGLSLILFLLILVLTDKNSFYSFIRNSSLALFGCCWGLGRKALEMDEEE